ncbi:MAG TPA: hypothetical protein PKU97_01155, partial [Kofleriaceae bacterium]|nr:hypothetical protein [Kofleriaceae bacterium]
MASSTWLADLAEGAAVGPALARCGPAELRAAAAAPGLELVVLEVRALSSAAAAVQAAAESPAPVLYLAEPEHLPSLVPLPPQLPRLRERDDLVLRRDPPLLLWHRARRLVARAAAARAAHAAPDELTGLPGRKQFLERLSQRCVGARRGP